MIGALADRVVVELPGEQLSRLGSAQAAAQARCNPVVQPEVVASAWTLERGLVRMGTHGAAQAREEKDEQRQEDRGTPLAS